MKETKFSLADVLTALAALIFGFVCFLSANFLTLGDTRQSIINAAVIAVVLGGLALAAKVLKRTSGRFKTCFVMEMITLLLFVGAAGYVATSTFPHYFAVSGKKKEIQTKLRTGIIQAENMFAEYEKYAANRENLYREALKTAVAGKQINPGEYEAYGFDSNSIADEKQIETKMFTIHADLFPSNFTEMKQVSSDWLVKSRNIVEKWKPIGIVGVVNEVEQNSNEWLKQLTELSLKRETNEQAKDFVYNLSFDDVKKDFNTLAGQPAPLSLGLAALAYAIMLLSYFVSKRHSRFPGFKIVFGGGKGEANEL